MIGLKDNIVAVQRARKANKRVNRILGDVINPAFFGLHIIGNFDFNGYSPIRLNLCAVTDKIDIIIFHIFNVSADGEVCGFKI